MVSERAGRQTLFVPELRFRDGASVRRVGFHCTNYLFDSAGCLLWYAYTTYVVREWHRQQCKVLVTLISGRNPFAAAFACQIVRRLSTFYERRTPTENSLSWCRPSAHHSSTRKTLFFLLILLHKHGWGDPVCLDWRGTTLTIESNQSARSIFVQQWQ